jgi:hypothetical protein
MEKSKQEIEIVVIILKVSFLWHLANQSLRVCELYLTRDDLNLLEII